MEETPEKVVFTLHYPEWEAAGGIKVALDKTVTVIPDTYFCDVEDIYTFEGADSLTIAAGMNIHAALETVEKESILPDRVAIWEHASDQTFEPEDGLLGVAVIVPGAGNAGRLSGDGTHLLVAKTVASGEPFRYSFGTCWSKGNIRTDEEWFSLVAGR